MGRIFFMAFIGALAGLIAWTITAPFAPTQDTKIDVSHITQKQNIDQNGSGLGADPRIDQQKQEAEKLLQTPAEQKKMMMSQAAYESLFMTALGALVGLAIGAGYGFFQGSKTHAIRGGLIGLVVGIIGCLLGYSIGGSITTMIYGPGFLESPLSPLIPRIVGRTIAITPIGILLGAVMGIPAKSFKQATVGLIGGGIAGFLSGVTFDLVCSIIAPTYIRATGNSEVGAPSRALLAIGIGLGIGLFTSLLQVATKTAWVRRIYGRNEFKEWVVDANQTSIGRAETCHIPIFGDNGVAPMHAMIQKHQGNYFLADCGSGAPTLLNGQPITQVPLFSGAIIQVGGTQLEFVLKQGSAPQRSAEQYRSQYPASGQMAAPVPQAAAPVGYMGGQPTQVMPQQGMMPTQMQPTQPMGVSNPTVVQQAYAPQQAPMGQTTTLVAMSGPLSGQRFPITGPIELGRDCPTVPLAFDSMVSRRHATLVPGAAGVQLNDLGSTNGTFVNDQRVSSSTTLRPGDIVRIGSTVFRVELS